MSIQTVIGGYILCSDHKARFNRRVIDHYSDYDDGYLFTNIFSSVRQQYFLPIISFTASYKNLDYEIYEWLFKFCRLLHHLDALEAFVYLDGFTGFYRWRLEPRDRYLGVSAPGQSQLYQEWGIADSPPPETEHHLMELAIRDHPSGYDYPQRLIRFPPRSPAPGPASE